MKAELMTTFPHEAWKSIQINVGSHGSRVSILCFFFFFYRPRNETGAPSVSRAAIYDCISSLQMLAGGDNGEEIYLKKQGLTTQTGTDTRVHCLFQRR